MKLAVIIFSAFSIVCCANKGYKYDKFPSKSGTPANQVSKNLTINVFTTLPKEINGCACYFFSSDQDKKEGKHICVNDFANLAFMSINGNLEKFELSKHEDNSDIFIYSNKNFNLKILITKTEAGTAESYNVEGIITVKTKDGIELNKKFVGLCGC